MTTGPSIDAEYLRSGSRTLVVNLVGEPAHGLLAESRFVDRTFLPGGEHNMYELAFAAVVAGYRVELRGWLERRAFDDLRGTLGLAPKVNLPARPPSDEDLIVVPEGWQDPLEYARLLLSPAAVAMFVLAPPGLFGWPFCSPGWVRPNPLTIGLDTVATASQFRAIHGLGITLLTHSPGIVDAAERAGVPCAFVGTGRPLGVQSRILTSENATRTTDVAGLLVNRWAPLVRSVAADLGDLQTDLIDEVPNAEVIAKLSRARVLLWPSRIEGHATVPWEARSVGCVPVALSTNRFAVGLSEATGALVVDTIGELAPAIRSLLQDRDRWSELSARARRCAREEADWDTYVKRVRLVLSGVKSPGAEKSALAGMGAALKRWQTDQSERAQAHLEELAAERERLIAGRDQLARDRDQLASDLAELQRSRAVRVARRVRSFQRRRSASNSLADRGSRGEADNQNHDA